MEDNERRVGRRYSVSIPCKFVSNEGGWQGRVRNLSLDGAFVEADECPLPGTLGRLSFEGENGVQATLSTRVVHRSRLEGRSDEIEGFGLYFVDVDEDARICLKRILSLTAVSPEAD